MLTFGQVKVTPLGNLKAAFPFSVISVAMLGLRVFQFQFWRRGRYGIGTLGMASRRSAPHFFVSAALFGETKGFRVTHHRVFIYYKGPLSVR